MKGYRSTDKVDILIVRQKLLEPIINANEIPTGKYKIERLKNKDIIIIGGNITDNLINNMNIHKSNKLDLLNVKEKLACDKLSKYINDTNALKEYNNWCKNDKITMINYKNKDYKFDCDWGPSSGILGIKYIYDKFPSAKIDIYGMNMKVIDDHCSKVSNKLFKEFKKDPRITIYKTSKDVY
jgi:hypothetical protein